VTGSRVAGVGIALPERRVSNSEVAAPLGVDDGWIFERTGIRARRFAAPGDTTSSLGATAAERCLAATAVEPDEIDLTICATITPDVRFPAAACLIQARLGAGGAAYDLNAGCSGFLFALAQADAAVRSGAARKVLVVGAEVLSRITDPSDRSTAILFGDGAGAALVERSEENALGPFSLHSDGSRPELLCVPEEEGVIRMRGREVYRAAVAGMSTAASEVLGAARAVPDDVDLLIAHQANRRILDAVAQRLSLPQDKVFGNIERLGNTSAASIPLALHDAAAGGQLREGDRVLLAAFGAGFCWGAGMMTWSASRVDGRATPSQEMAHV